MSLSFVQENFHIGQASPDLSPQFIFYKRGFSLGSGSYTPGWREVTVSGTSSVVLANSLANSLLSLKLFGNAELLPETYIDSVTAEGKCEQRNLPSGYTQVEYLESSGTQYIDTGIKDITNSEFEVVAQQTSTGGTFPTIMGALDNNDNYKVICGLSTTGNDFYSQCGGPSGFIVSTVPNDTSKHTFKVVTSSGQQTLQVDDDTAVIGSYAITDTTQYSLTICARNKATVSNFTSQKVYSVRIKKNGVLVRNLISARRNSDNVLGMYDTVSDTFLTNQGTGTFTAGSDVTPSPDYPMDIVCNNGVIKVSPNLTNYGDSSWQDGYFQPNGSIGNATAGQDEMYSTTYIPVSPNTDYTLSNSYSGTTLPTNTWGAVNWYDSTKTFISRVTDSTSIEANPKVRTFTSPANAAYARVSIRTYKTTSNAVYNVQFELGSTATTYRPYGQIYTDGTQETITDNVGNVATCQNLLSVGTYKDTQEILSGAVTRNIGIKVLDGTENWVSGTGSYSGNCYCDDILPNVKAPATAQDNSYAICTAFDMVKTLAELSLNKGWISNNPAGRINLWYGDTAANFKTYLAQQYANGTPVIVTFPLATATSETVTGQVLNKTPLTTVGSISDLVVTATSSSHTTPTPTQPLQINCNNGVVKVNAQGQIYTDGTQEKVEVFGKNLFDNQHIDADHYILAATGVVTQDSEPTGGLMYSCTDYIPVQPNTTYYKSGDFGAGVQSYFDINKNLLDHESKQNTTFTTPNNCYFVKANLLKSNSPWNTAQIELGSTATTYEPYYYGGSALAEMLLKVGTYQDVQSVLNGGITRKVGVKVLTGDEDWTASGTIGGNTWRFAGSGITSTTTGADVSLCTHIDRIIQSNTSSQSNRPCIRFSTTDGSPQFYPTKNTMTLEDWINWLTDQYNAGQPVIIVYPLSTATTESVTAQSLTIQEGTNIVEITEASMDNLELEVSYKAGVEVTITEVENAQLDNSVEVTIS